MRLIIDTIDGAEIDIGTEKGTATRTGVVSDIPAALRSDPFVLARAIMETGGPQIYEPHPYFGTLRLNRIVARPANDSNTAMVRYTYEGPSPSQGDSNSAAILVVEDSTTTVVEQTAVDLNGLVIQAVYRYYVATTSGPSPSKEILAPKTVTMPQRVPRRHITVSGLLFGRKAPSSWSRKAIGCVNNAPWPTGSLWSDDEPDKAGYWMVDDVNASVDRFRYQVFEAKTRPYRVRAVFSSRVRRDWREFGFFRNAFGQIPKEVADQASDLKKLIFDTPYSTTQDFKTVNGVVAVGLADPVDFPSIFGF